MSDVVADLLKKLEDGIQNFKSSDAWKAYLNMQANFHDYSFGNIILIMLQYPTASRVAGFKAWNSMGRTINKGEHPIKILAPNIYYKKFKVENKETGLEEEKERKMLAGFHYANVFDVSQTQGKELPCICAALSGSEHDDIYKAMLNVIDIPVREDKVSGDAKGYFDPVKKEIVISNEYDINQRAKTVIHEEAHYLLHSESHGSRNRMQEETEAESVAYIVCSYFGFDTSEYSFPYIAGWDNNESFKKSGATIQKTAQSIIEKIEGVLLKKAS